MRGVLRAPSSFSAVAVAAPQRPRCAATGTQRHIRAAAQQSDAALKQQSTVVLFREEGVSAAAAPGEDLLDVAARCGVVIPTGCLHGSCGVCEVRLRRI